MNKDLPLALCPSSGVSLAPSEALWNTLSFYISIHLTTSVALVYLLNINRSMSAQGTPKFKLCLVHI